MSFADKPDPAPASEESMMDKVSASITSAAEAGMEQIDKMNAYMKNEGYEDQFKGYAHQAMDAINETWESVKSSVSGDKKTEEEKK